ncbi:gp16 family protein [Pigmentiphaga kullae]|uniref:Phage gp16-like protein n=1 Tax=Pigmentiphaga kullae TaxID=151784 RepID=A0A4Q7NMC3_9BURK|nr:regulatory protein GemA [Pigmentiphaga kullae]RZS86036.1 phage gp16-like protein [Pigmentiphaga kullae]
MNVPDRRLQLIRLVHVAARELQLDKDTYRAALQAATTTAARPGKSSAAEMSAVELERVLAHFKRTGFKVRSKDSGGRQGRPLDQSPTASKLRAVWLDLASLGIIRDASEAALAAWVQRETGIAAIDWLDGEQRSKCIEKAKKWRDRIIHGRRVALAGALGVAFSSRGAGLAALRKAIDAAAQKVLGRSIDVESMHEDEYQLLLRSAGRPQ